MGDRRAGPARCRAGHRRGERRVCGDGSLAFILAAILEPYRYGFGLQIKLLGERLALFARGVGSEVEELLEHGELGASEALASALRA